MVGNSAVSGPEEIPCCDVCSLELTDDERGERVTHECPPGFQS